MSLNAEHRVCTLEAAEVVEPPKEAAGVQPSSLSDLVPTMSPVQQCQLAQLLEAYEDVLNRDDEDIDQTPMLEHNIETQGPPVQLPYHRHSPTVRQEEAEQIQHMLENGIIRPSNSPCASPVVMVQKKDGKLSFCVDFRQLNAATVRDAHHLPRIDDLLDALHGACWFSLLTSRVDTGRCPSEKRTNKPKTAFRTSSGQLYEFN